ncbi:MAG: sulfotransferase family 2 domain-containing protein [Ilyomonas sp.]
MEKTHKSFFWLNCRKCAGTSFRNSFTPPYVQTKRGEAKPFVAVPKEEWNDVLNNFRVPLGEYEYKRMLFAKKFLYSEEEFNDMYKFVIVRNPYDRAVSIWKWVFRNKEIHAKRFLMKYSFRYFLSQLPRYFEMKHDRQIIGHAAPVWSDITDHDGNVLVDGIFKLEEMDEAIKIINKKIGTNIPGLSKKNVKRQNDSYRKHYDSKTKKLVEEIYGYDIEKLGYSF